jgi:hypothetical protein
VTNTWLAGLRLLAQSVRTPRYRAAPEALPKLNGAISILCPEDAALVRIAVAHAAGRPADETDFATLCGWGPNEFFAMSLLRARQARLRGNGPEAEDWYNRLFEEVREARDRDLDFLLDVEDRERGG